MNRHVSLFCLGIILVAIAAVEVRAVGQETAATPAVEAPAQTEEAQANDGKAADPNAAARANEAFSEKFKEYKAALGEIEKLNVAYQTADEATRKKLNEQMTGQIAHAQSLINAMVDAAVAAYRFAPNADPKITDLLVAVAKYYTIGRQIGPGESSPGNPEDVFFPIDGGDQYERALPIIKLLIDGGTDNKQLYVWGFLAAFMTNDYDLAAQYLAKADETGALQEVAKAAAKDPNQDPEAGLMQGVMMLLSATSSKLDQYRGLWAKESEIRAAEAKADDLPRVKLTTTKGEITIELFENEAPQSVANFLALVKKGYYDGTPFHRVLPKFMAQGGDPTGEGTGGPGYNIRGEADVPNYRNHFRGTLSMAHSGHPDSGGSQFFLTFVPTTHLNAKHTAFGRVIEGMEVLGDLQRRSAQHQQNPPEPDKILKAEVIRDRGHEYTFEKLSER